MNIHLMPRSGYIYGGVDYPCLQLLYPLPFNFVICVIVDDVELSDKIRTVSLAETVQVKNRSGKVPRTCTDQNDSRLTTDTATDPVQPEDYLPLLRSHADVPNNQVNGSGRKEKRVRRLISFLPSKIPEVKSNAFLANERVGHFQRAAGGAVCRGLSDKRSSDERVHKTCLASPALAEKNDFRLIYFVGRLRYQAPHVGKHCVVTLAVSGAESGRQGVAVDAERAQRRYRRELYRNRAKRVIV